MICKTYITKFYRYENNELIIIDIKETTEHPTEEKIEEWLIDNVEAVRCEIVESYRLHSKTLRELGMY